jgi:hypothetical protein
MEISEIKQRIKLLEGRIYDSNNHPRNPFFIGVKIASETELKQLRQKLRYATFNQTNR